MGIGTGRKGANLAVTALCVSAAAGLPMMCIPGEAASGRIRLAAPVPKGLIVVEPAESNRQDGYEPLPVLHLAAPGGGRSRRPGGPNPRTAWAIAAVVIGTPHRLGGAGGVEPPGRAGTTPGPAPSCSMVGRLRRPGGPHQCHLTIAPHSARAHRNGCRVPPRARPGRRRPHQRLPYLTGRRVERQSSRTGSSRNPRRAAWVTRTTLCGALRPGVRAAQAQHSGPTSRHGIHGFHVV